jgi:hypothetical protein
MRRYFIILLLFLGSNAWAKDLYIPSTKILYLDEVADDNTLYKNVAVEIEGYTVKSIGSQESVSGGGLYGSTGGSDVPVNFVNNQSVPVYVSFTIYNADDSPGPITWGTNCLNTGVGPNAAYAMIDAGTTCSATVDPTQFPPNGVLGGSSRFCASTAAPPDNCSNAQNEFLTMIETNFQPYVANPNGSCFNNMSCVWYDISLIPNSTSTPCTDAAWKLNNCAGAGRAAYNLPVQLSCNANPTYTCQGPITTKWGNHSYPGSCGNPDATCATGTPNCESGVSAYFYPMFEPPESSYQPNAVCPNGNTLTITFLAGT